VTVGFILTDDATNVLRIQVLDAETDAVLYASPKDDLDNKVNRIFAGKVVRKDLVRRVKVGANVPVFVLEFLLGKYCASSDELAIQMGLNVVNDTLAENYIRADESMKAQSKVKEKGRWTFIDKVKVRLVDSDYWAEVNNFGNRNVHIPNQYVRDLRYVGEPVAVVLGDSPALAEDGVGAIAIDIEELPPVPHRHASGRREILLFEEAGTNAAMVFTGVGRDRRLRLLVCQNYIFLSDNYHDLTPTGRHVVLLMLEYLGQCESFSSSPLPHRDILAKLYSTIQPFDAGTARRQRT
jgi:Putative ATP-dependent Lon protease